VALGKGDLFNFSVAGVKELTNSLDKLGPKVEVKVLRGAVNFGLTPLVTRAKSTVTARGHGGLEESLGKRMKVYKSTGWVYGMVGARARKGMRDIKGEWGGTRTAIPSKYAHIVEGGSKPHTLKAGQQRVGAKLGLKRLLGGGRIQHPGTKATHFLKRSFRAVKPKMEERFVKKLGKGIEKAAAEAAKRAAAKTAGLMSGLSP